ncbi:hypothetical protein J2X36_002495 [Methylobacterium sp. BE186]|nr:hypothetical protein [Methylobacterium sp. BE186]
MKHPIFSPITNSHTSGDRSVAFSPYFPNAGQDIASKTKTTFFCPYFPVQMRTETGGWPLEAPAAPKRSP